MTQSSNLDRKTIICSNNFDYITIDVDLTELAL